MERIRTSAAISWLCLLLLLVSMPGYSAPAAEGEPPAFKPEELEALVAPIALYPDPLLAQVLMASTYPLEIVHAARWLKENPNLKGDAAVQAVGDQPWDVSVKSLVAFPQILDPMNQKLDWTQKLGDAFLAQQQDVFAAVQRLRKRAQDAGNLASTAQQTVVVDPPPQASQPAVVRIEPANPEVIYVPAYNPSVVYGGWSAPAYPPTYWPPPPAYYPGTALMSGLAFGVGLAAVGAIYSDCNWGGGDVDIDYNKVTNIDRNFNRDQVQARAQGQGQSGTWQHNPSHRQGVAYRDNATRQKMAGQVPGEDKRASYRGRGADTGAATVRGAADRGGGANRADAATGAGAAGRANAGVRPSAGTGNRAASADRASPQRRGATDANRNAANRAAQGRAPDSRNPARRDSAFTDVSAGGAATQRSHDRGRSSVQASGANRPSGSSGTRGAGGGSRGGGGGGGRR